ncbi:MAG: hypothetical protein HRT88_00765 [Lentisphaeraceae bacterium]|nr:hypothetical protein [Lentisphaeraceae bacterium]
MKKGDIYYMASAHYDEETDKTSVDLYKWQVSSVYKKDASRNQEYLVATLHWRDETYKTNLSGGQLVPSKTVYWRKKRFSTIIGKSLAESAKQKDLGKSKIAALRLALATERKYIKEYKKGFSAEEKKSAEFEMKYLKRRLTLEIKKAADKKGK